MKFLLKYLLIICALCSQGCEDSQSLFQMAVEGKLPPTVPTDSISLPRPLGFVSDYENIFTIDQERLLDSQLKSFEHETGIQIALVTLDSSQVQSRNFKKYTLALARYWGVGAKGKDNGVLIGLCIQSKELQIQNGYGIASQLTNEKTKDVIEKNFMPGFKAGDYFVGIEDGIRELTRSLKLKPKI